MAYTKTNWNESTPITVDRLNNIENGIASALPLAGGTLTGKIEVPGESRFYQGTYVDPWHGKGCVIKASGHVGIGGSLKVNEKLAFSNFGIGGGTNANIHNLALHSATGNGQMLTADSESVYVGNPETNLILESNRVPSVNIGGSVHQLIHTGNLTQKMTFGKYSSKNWADAQIEINAGTSAGGVARLNFHRENNSQMSILHKVKDQLHIEYDNGTQQRILTEGDSCARFSWNGSRISIDGGGNNASVAFADVSEIARHLHNHHTGQNFALRAAAGLAPADGWLTMTW